MTDDRRNDLQDRADFHRYLATRDRKLARASRITSHHAMAELWMIYARQNEAEAETLDAIARAEKGK